MKKNTLVSHQVIKSALFALVFCVGCGGMEENPDPSIPATTQSVPQESPEGTSSATMEEVNAAGFARDLMDRAEFRTQQNQLSKMNGPTLKPIQDPNHTLLNKDAILQYGKKQNSSPVANASSPRVAATAGPYQPDQIDPNTLKRLKNGETQPDSQSVRLCSGGTWILPADLFVEIMSQPQSIELNMLVEDTHDQTVLKANGLQLGIRNSRIFASFGRNTVEGTKVEPHTWFKVSVTASTKGLSLTVDGVVYESGLQAAAEESEEQEAAADNRGPILIQPTFCVELVHFNAHNQEPIPGPIYAESKIAR